MMICGLDLGRTADYSALSVLRRQHLTKPIAKRRYRYQIVWIEAWELGTMYTQIIQGVKRRIAGTPQLVGVPLAVDYTGVGTAVVEQIQAARVPCRLHSILITAGHKIKTRDESDDGAWHVPKKELVSNLLVLAEADLIKVNRGVPLAAKFEKELASFRTRVNNDTKNELFGADASQKDDLVLSVALAAWLAEHIGDSGDVSMITSGGGSMNLGTGSIVQNAPDGVFLTGEKAE
jgi:hypothetical protein